VQNIEATIQKQFANSPVLVALLGSINAYLDQSTNLQSFYSNIWNLLTASGYGLDVWGRIVGVSRVLAVSSTPYFGFEEANEWVGFGQAPFYTGAAITSNYALADSAFLTLIYAKALSNISDGSIPSINKILMTLFGAMGDCYCTDGQNMTMTYTFSFAPNAVDLAIITQSGVLPRPPGVSLSVAVAPGT
jgi:hypothetical protein